MSTNYARAKYQEIYDINTQSNKVSVIGIHTPTGAKPRQMLSGFFTQFRKYKYSGCSVLATPSARLPLSLAQLSVEAGSSAVNPKDVWNPILVRGCHGDNLNDALNSIYKGSFDSMGSSIDKDDHADTVVPSGSLTWEQMYYRMLQDPSFKKFSMSSGMKLTGLHPMVYNVASTTQIQPIEGKPNIGQLEYIANPSKTDISHIGFNVSTDGGIADGEGSVVPVFPRMMTNRLQRLGWLDTKQYLNANTSTAVSGFTTLPKILMAVCVIPMAKSADVVTSMRFVVTHYFEFKEFNTSLTLEGASEYYDWLTATSSKQNDTFDVNSSDDNIEIITDGVF